MNTTATYPDKKFPDSLTFADALRFNDRELTEHLLRKGCTGEENEEIVQLIRRFMGA